MRKILFFVLCVFILCGCNKDEKSSDPSMNSSLRVEAKFVKLVDNNSEIAGEVVFTTSSKEVAVKWNTDSICNLNTSQTMVRLKNGRGTLPVRWEKKQGNGDYGPEQVAYKAGVLLTDKEYSQYIPLVWAEMIDSTKIAETIPLTRTAEGVLPRVAQVSMMPTTVNLNYENGGAMIVNLIDVPYAVFDLSEFTSDMNLDMTQIPNYITATQPINFKWKAGGAPAIGFTARIIAMAEGIYQIGNVIYNPQGPEPDQSLTYINSNLPTGNIPQNGGTYTFTFEGTYIGGVQVRALADGVIIATGAEVTNKQPSVTVTQNMTGDNRNITFQYKRADGNWTNLPATTNKVQSITGGGGGDINGGISCAGYVWAPANLTKVGYTFQFHTTQSQFTGIWNGGDYWNWNVLDPYTYTTAITYWNSTNDPCMQVAPAGTWRTPTTGEMQALINAGSSWGTLNGVSGRYFGPARELFLPAAGWRANSSTAMSNGNIAGLYWTNTVANAGLAYALGIQNNNVRLDARIPRSEGNSIRCVAAR